jgi:hypothetical protein
MLPAFGSWHRQPDSLQILNPPKAVALDACLQRIWQPASRGRIHRKENPAGARMINEGMLLIQLRNDDLLMLMFQFRAA